MCESWRLNKTKKDFSNDVYDGKVWKEFLKYNDQSFLELPYNYALLLNIDWSQPFDHTNHSEGVIYLAVMNIERKQRFLQENMILVGVIPGPREPKSNINSFLRPLIDELLKLWHGVMMKTESGLSVIVRAALLCVACDIPAARKTCGFVGHSANHGCSKCLVTFLTHLKECIVDFGPVYAFWLFGCERLNGIMGSYHTNNRNISVQLTRRFLDSVQYTYCNWPREVSAEFVPLLEQFRYNQGSLLQAHFDTSEKEIIPLSPVKEVCLDAAHVDLVQRAFARNNARSGIPLLLYKHAEGLKTGSYMIGSNSSRYFRSSVVFATKNKGEALSLAQVEYFAQCSIVVSSSNNQLHTEWLAAVSWFEVHPFRVWFGNPTEVWCSTQTSFEFIPICDIKHRAIYTKASVDFGRWVGTDTVLVASPSVMNYIF